MGGFFLFDSGAEVAVDRVRGLFRQRGYAAPSVNVLGRTTLLHFPKLSGQVEDPAKLPNGDRLFVSGSMIYRGMAGSAAQSRFLKDVCRDAPDCDDLIGGFFASYWNAEKSSLQFFTDRTGLYHVFADLDHTFLTSSFMAAVVASSSEGSVDSESVFENLMLGCVMAPRTIATGVCRIHPEHEARRDFRLGRFWEPPQLDDSPSCSSRRGCVEDQVSVLRHTMRKMQNDVNPERVAMGLSGGYDSRLLILLARDAGLEVVAHSHFKTAPDLDPVVARSVAAAVGVPLLVPKTIKPEEMDNEALANTVKNALLFFDGRANSQMELLKEEYTAGYRNSVHQGARLVLGGVGGEIYRNHDRSPSGSLNPDLWLSYFVLGYPAVAAVMGRSTRRRIVGDIGGRICNRLRMRQGERIGPIDRRRFYERVWLPDWHGLRNSVESQFATYVSPFAHPPVLRAARAAIPYLGSSGEFEAAMIHAMNPDIAKLPSSYGFPFSRVPAGERFGSWLKSAAPTSLKLGVGVVRASRLQGNENQIHWWERRFPFLRRAMGALRDLQLPLDLDQFASNRTRCVFVLSVACSVAAMASGPDPNRW